MTTSRRQSRHFLRKTNAGMGNTPRVSCWRRIPAAWSPRSVNDMDLWFLGSAHGVPNDELCLRWMSMACSEIKLVRIKTFSDRRVSLFPHLFPHLDACCQSTVTSTSTWTCCNVPPVAQSIPIARKLALNTIAKEEYAQSVLCGNMCIATDWSVAWMCTHHGLWIHNLNEKQP